MKGHVTLNWLISDDHENYACFFSIMRKLSQRSGKRFLQGLITVSVYYRFYDSVMIDYITLTGDLIMKVILIKD